MVSPDYMLAHCKGELGRGKPHRCPQSWLRIARREALRIGDESAAEACRIALLVNRGELPSDEDTIRPMRKLAGRRLS